MADSGDRVSEDGVIEGRENDQAVSVDNFDGTVNNGVGREEEIKPFPTGASADPAAAAAAAAGRNRQTLGRWKLGKLKHDCKLGHNKFEGMTVQDSHIYYEHRRFPGGGNPARGKSRGEGRGSPNNNTYNNNSNNNQTSGPKSARGRGPIRCHQPSTQNAFEAPEQSRRPAKPMEKTSHASSGRASESAQVGLRKNVVSISVSPSGSSSKETNSAQKKGVQSNWGPRPSVMSPHHPVSKFNVAATCAEARGPFSPRQMYNQPVPPRNNVTRRNLQTSSGSRASSPPKTSSLTHGLESTDLEFSTESNDSKTALAEKGTSEMAWLPGAAGPDITMDGAGACPSDQPAALPISKVGNMNESSFEALITEMSLTIEDGIKKGLPAEIIESWEAALKEILRTPHLIKPIHELTDDDWKLTRIRVRDEPDWEYDDPYEDDTSHPDSRWK